MVYEHQTIRAQSAGIMVQSRPNILAIHPPLRRTGRFRELCRQSSATDVKLSTFIPKPTDLSEPLSPTSPGSILSSSSDASSVSSTSSNTSASSKITVSTAPISPALSTPQSWHYFIPSMPCTKTFDDTTMYMVLSHDIQRVIQSQSQTPDISKPDPWHRNSRFELPEIFRSVCICDPKTRGNPIQFRSRHFVIGPRSLKTGDCQFLNLPTTEQHDSFNLTCRQGADGRPQFVLEYAGGLISHENGTVAWILASQMDVTDMMRSLTACMITSNRQKEEEMMRPSLYSDRDDMDGNKPEMHLGNNINGILRHTNQPRLDESKGTLNGLIDWVATATEILPRSPAPSNEGILPPEALTSLQAVIHHLRAQHQYCFTLSRSANKISWQLSYSSFSSYHNAEDIKASFHHTDKATMGKLRIALSKEPPARIELRIRWGVKGCRKWFYGVPMFRARLECWMCFLVDRQLEG